MWLKRVLSGVLVGVLVSLNISGVSAFALDADNVVPETYESAVDSTENIFRGGFLPEDEGFFEDVAQSSHAANVSNTSILGNSSLPSSVDLSATSYFPPIADQTVNGPCASFATTYYQFTYEVAKLNNWTDVATNTAHQMSPGFTYAYASLAGDSEGSSIQGNFQVLQMQGCLSIADSPYVSTTTGLHTQCSDEELLRKALKTRVADYKTVSFANSSSSTPITNVNSEAIVTIKSLLSDGHVLTFGTSADFVVDNPNAYQQTIFYTKYSAQMRHVMTIVGYDDAYYYDMNGDGIKTANEYGALKVVNSWGHNSGGVNFSGYYWVMYDALNVKSSDASLNGTNRCSFCFDVELSFDGTQLTERITNYLVNYIEVANYDPQCYMRLDYHFANVSDDSSSRIALYREPIQETSVANYTRISPNFIIRYNTYNASSIVYLDLSAYMQEVSLAELYNYQWGIAVRFENNGLFSGTMQIRSNTASLSASKSITFLNNDPEIEKIAFVRATAAGETYSTIYKNGAYYVQGVSSSTRFNRFIYNYGETYDYTGDINFTSVSSKDDLELLGTGDQFTRGTSTTIFTIVITGDVNGDGVLSVSDVVVLRQLVLNGTSSDALLLAGDINGDNALTSSDVVLLRQMILDTSSISAEEFAVLEAQEYVKY